MTDLLTFSHTSAFEITTLSCTQSLKKVCFLGVANTPCEVIRVLLRVSSVFCIALFVCDIHNPMKLLYYPLLFTTLYLFNDIVLDINHKLAGLLPPKAEHHRQLRSSRKFNVPVCKTDRLKKSFIVSHSLRM